MSTKIPAVGLLTLSLTALGATAALAQSQPADAALAEAFSAATVTIAKAITAAEADTGGRALAVESRGRRE